MADRKAVKDLKASDTYKIIRQDLFDELDRLGVYGEHFKDLVEDYMSLWITKNLLIDDINKRGVSIKIQKNGVTTAVKKNESISELNKTNAQMLKLLNELKIKPSIVATGDDSDEL